MLFDTGSHSFLIIDDCLDEDICKFLGDGPINDKYRSMGGIAV